MFRNRSTRIAILAALLTIAYLIGLSFNLSPWLRGPEEWRWSYVIPGSFRRIWLPALLLVGYLFFILWLQPRLPKRWRTLLTLLVASLMTVAIQLGLLYLEQKDVRSQLFYRTVSELSGGFFNVGSAVTDSADFLDNYAENMSGFPVHPQRHPPGLPLLFASLRQFLDQQPQIAGPISAVLRPYQCHNLALMNLPNSAIASAIVQMLLPLWLALVVWPLYYFGRLLYDKQTGERAALLWPLLPSVALWATRWNHLYALFTLLAFILLHVGLSRDKKPAFFLSGLVLSGATWFSFGNLALVGFMGLYALIWFVTRKERPAVSWLLLSAGVVALGAILPWIIVSIAFDFDPITTWQNTLAVHLGLGRSYTTWLFYHLYDFFVFLGIPLFVAWAAGTIKAFRAIKREPADVLAISAAIGLLLLNLSGTSQGEVARVWAFLLPLFLLVAVRYLSDKTYGFFAAIVTLLVLQLFVSNIYLRPVGTGLLDPPAPPPAASPVTADTLGIWEEGPVLLAAELPQNAIAGRPIQIQLSWRADRQIQRPYTIFVHLVDQDSKLVAQQDGLPLGGEWLTTCWQPGESFKETIEIITPAEAEPGDYQVLVGFYWLPTGERLAITLPAGQVENSLNLGGITLDKG